MSSVKGRDHFVRLGVDVRSDLMWWQLFLETWNGIGILPNSKIGHIDLFTDASGKWGCAGVWDTMWFHWKWSEKAREWHIAPKELLPVVLVCVMWGKEWRGKKVTCHCDNMAVVEVLNSGYSKDKNIMHMLRCLFFISEHHQFLVEAVHMPGKLNQAADAISQNNISHLLQVRITRGSTTPNTYPRPGLAIVSRGSTRLDIPELDRTVHRMYQAGLAPSTQRAYKAGKKKYLEFCGRVAISPLPVSETMLCSFIAFLRLEGLHHQTAKSHLSAIRHLQI